MINVNTNVLNYVKQLEEELSTVTMYHGCNALINQLKQENQQLKQELKDERAEIKQLYSHLGVEAFGENIQEQAVKKIDKLEEENKLLKHRLLEEIQRSNILIMKEQIINKKLAQQNAILQQRTNYLSLLCK